MIVGLDGVITKKEPTACVVKLASGVSYAVRVSLFTSAAVQKGERVEFLITQIIREDAHLMFGFLDGGEQRIFELLLKVNGVGAATALAVCSTLKPAQVQSAVARGDEAAFRAVPGIGPKGARMIIAQLGDKKLDLGGAADGGGEAQQTAYLALSSLGFKDDKIAKTLALCSAQTPEELIKEALKKMK